MAYDYINPAHYKQEGRKESIEEIEEVLGYQGAMNFCFGNAMKYLYRMGNKPKESADRDKKKTEWYLNRIEYYNLAGLAYLTPNQKYHLEELWRQVK